jgi:MarR family transcriptional regulator, lower aerobic nicotinate degradation pathway regulator
MQAAAIMVLHDHGSISQAELGRTIGMEPANVHGLIARLRSGGLLELHADERDNRKTNVSLSPSGRRRAARIATLTAEAAEMTLDVFNDREREQFFALLNRYAFADEG